MAHQFDTVKTNSLHLGTNRTILRLIGWTNWIFFVECIRNFSSGPFAAGPLVLRTFVLRTFRCRTFRGRTLRPRTFWGRTFCRCTVRTMDKQKGGQDMKNFRTKKTAWVRIQALCWIRNRIKTQKKRRIFFNAIWTSKKDLQSLEGPFGFRV